MKCQRSSQEVGCQVKGFDSVQEPARLRKRQRQNQDIRRHKNVHHSPNYAGQIEQRREVSPVAKQR